MPNLKKTIEKLGFNTCDGLYYAQDGSWNEIPFPSRIKRLLGRKIRPDAFFCVDNKPLILFFENPKNIKELHQAVWNFNESPVIIIVEKDKVEIFNGFRLSEPYNGLLDKIGGEEKLNDFSYFKLVTGQTWEDYQYELNYRNRVDYKLLSEIRSAREFILDKFSERNDEVIAKENAKITNALLGKTIFIRYLIDKKVELNYNDDPKIWTNDDFCALLKVSDDVKCFFNYLADPEKGFNGDLFPLTEKEYSKIPQDAYDIIIRLLKSEGIAQGQLALFDLYDFSIIPVEFISNVYESFIGIENQAKEGAYYTPLFLVDYILSETVDKHIEDLNVNYCKVLDPACGSGVFLVETLRKLIEQYLSKNSNPSRNSEKFKADIKELVEKNIFGVDKDESAIQVAIFSIYLTLLDYMDPPEISKFKFPNLFNTNLFYGDFFDQTADFNSILKNVGLSFIIGNPPWMRGKHEKGRPLYLEYIKERRRIEKKNPSINIGNKEIAQAFLLRSSDFSTEYTKCALIVTSKVLYNLQSSKFRQYFLHHYAIERIFELAPVRREVFDKSNKPATTPACVLFFKYANGKETDSNIIEHIALKPSRFFSLFKIFAISRTDIQSVQQRLLKEFDWLWKILVYGSYLDFNFIKRLKNDFKSLEDSLESGTLVKQGIKRCDGKKKINVEKLAGWDFLDLRKEIGQLHITQKHEKWKLKEVGYIYRENDEICEEMFSPPMLLIKETTNTRLESVAAVSSQKLLFTDKITSVKFRNEKNADNYYLLASLMNSALFGYYVLNTSSTAGIMIEQQINDTERFSFPYINSGDIIQKAKEIESLKEKEYSAVMGEYDTAYIEAKGTIDQLISNSFGLNNIEQTLLDYSKNVVIPIIMKHKRYKENFSPCNYEDLILKDYATLFLDRFQSKYNVLDKEVVVEVWFTKQIVGMFFKVVPKSEQRINISWINKQNGETKILQVLATLGTTKITDRLFIQKDIRGFEKDYFYIFKPNEKRLWHKAIGYLDVNEFADAILKTGRGDYD